MDWEVVTVGRMTRFLGAVVMARWRGPGGRDDREDDAAPGRGADDQAAWTRQR
jgi:hypothetical protein